MYVALMAEPTFSQFSKFMPVSKKDEVSGYENACQGLLHRR